ncbi:Gluconate 2-dehydrogenase (acceptor) [Gluconacetobacter diazotrophicus PA1 5]|uniref:Puative alcohol dehydrogenase cytochrome c subunit n=2 Tax=Gluconacetobacter diazotrophicus TaxID=33996 RepID=A9HBE0_GLUDA|nr:cytochrome c [Gluconacetobacter diazotrophicus]ACI50942.1 Gluconate 2-dehydrogenase (acceptor) [Gluconacetobacter diazotrophicus PA1 5]MBB2156123.1 cytochrome c [Gluconacetobacter diazotrophicus]TWB08603.1 mono/diheme cytochrome c family protein [Gluconacetobacter diazotrophicus]CAP54803.1 puative alcohol dehydrogenase cytochrome c subunit precursor [Gluconacetobacter diazotrophicus PA1 5]
MIGRTARAAALVLVSFGGTALAQDGGDSGAGLVARGRYLATAADCVACHTAPNGGRPFAGGYGIASPLGTIYSSNITPSRHGGIGGYSEAQFAAAVRDGVRADGAHLYPAMPYTSYARMTDADIHALYAYFTQAVQPVDAVAPQTKLPFPFNVRLSLWGWNMLYLDRTRFTPDPARSAEVNRGAYLAVALAHCDTCHTPRNVTMAEIGDRNLGGAALGSWVAPNITPDPVSGIGTWSADELYRYLKTGDVPGKAQAAGPMAEAIEHSFQYLDDADLKAIVAYVRQVPAIRDTADRKARDAYGAASDSDALVRGAAPDTLAHGARLFAGDCAACHRPTGQGSQDGYYPQLFHNTATGARTPDNLIAAILQGVDRTVAGRHVYMPGFSHGSYVDELSDQDVADVSNYVLAQFGDPSVHVSAADVARSRAGGARPLLARVDSYIVPAMVAALAVVLALIWLLVARRRPA